MAIVVPLSIIVLILVVVLVVVIVLHWRHGAGVKQQFDFKPISYRDTERRVKLEEEDEEEEEEEDSKEDVHDISDPTTST